MRERSMMERQYVIDAMTVGDTWRMFRIMAEFVEGFEHLADISPAVSIFGSARVRPDAPEYQLTQRLAGLLVKRGYAVITGGPRHNGGGQQGGSRGRRAIGGAKHRVAF